MIEFIRQAFADGVSDEVIMQELLAEGYSEHAIEVSLQHYYRTFEREFYEK